MDSSTVVAASVHVDNAGQWWLTLERAPGEGSEVVRLGWDGTGRFHDEGLNAVAYELNARGLVYQSWQKVDDGYTAVVYPKVTWGQR